MSLGMLAAVLLQTGFIIVFILMLTPFRSPVKSELVFLGCFLMALVIMTSFLAARFGTMFLMWYGFVIIGVPLFLGIYYFSRAKGIRFVFVAMTAVVFQQMLLTLLMAFRIYEGGFTPFYFLLNLVAFGALLSGGYFLRKDFHKIVLFYRYEFVCLSGILLLLFLFAEVFSPIIAENTVDPDLLLVCLFFDLLIVLLYLYIGVSFRSLGRRIEMEKDALTLRFQMEEAENNLVRLRATQEQFFSWDQDRRHYISTIRTLLAQSELKKLDEYLDEIGGDLINNMSETYCKNEAINLLLASYSARGSERGIGFITNTQLPDNLLLSSTELYALLGNALDNAFRAAEAVDGVSDKSVHLLAKVSNGKLLIQVQNPYSGEVLMVNGLPRGPGKHQGFGVRSMEALVEKHGGLSSYEAKNGVFTVRFAF